MAERADLERSHARVKKDIDSIIKSVLGRMDHASTKETIDALEPGRADIGAPFQRP